ncbi:TPA: hypothetical protein ACGOVN_002145, partial [Streptococcus suis]
FIYLLTTSRKCALEISFILLDNFHYREELRIRNPKSVNQCRGNEKEDSQQYSISYRRKPHRYLSVFIFIKSLKKILTLSIEDDRMNELSFETVLTERNEKKFQKSVDKF